MPEGPEIRREARALARILVDQPLTRIEYRVPALARRARTLSGSRVTNATSHGKAMLIEWSNGLTHYSHNQLYGEWHVTRTDALELLLAKREPSIRVVIATIDNAAVLLSATNIELLTARELAAQTYLARLGPDVLDRSTTLARVLARFGDARFARRSLASLLLDQSFLAGLGNYLRSDILHASGLRHTKRPVELTPAKLTRLAKATLDLPRQSLRTAGTTNDPTLLPELAAQGVTRAERRFRVYAREGLPCWICATKIRRVDVGGRGIYFCPRCQPA
ncbi:MAG TPA: endonuclease VIII [Casimicrobiaceae bacterium]|nr:endonuclease VIII [Casimicrobiaceae bacterium]